VEPRISRWILRRRAEGSLILKARMILSSKHVAFNQESINNLLSDIAIFSLPNSRRLYSRAEEDYSFLSSSSMSLAALVEIDSSAMHAYSHVTSIIRQFKRYHMKIIRCRVSSFATSSSSWEIHGDSLAILLEIRSLASAPEARYRDAPCEIGYFPMDGCIDGCNRAFRAPRESAGASS